MNIEEAKLYTDPKNAIETDTITFHRALAFIEGYESNQKKVEVLLEAAKAVLENPHHNMGKLFRAIAFAEGKEGE